VEVLEVGRDQVRLSLAAGELLLLNNALNEVLNGIDVPEFDTRLGSSRENAQKLLAALTALLDKMECERNG
jgi:hypothetical protein